MAGKRPEIFLTQTNDIGRLLSTINKMPVHGFIDLPRAVKIAQLSLKHRQNKNQKQRIVVFVGSPIEGLEARDLTKLGKQLRKNDVAIDCISFGHPENVPLLQNLVDNCNKGGNSHLIEVQYGMNIADTLITSPIVAYDSGMGGEVPADGEGAAAPSTGGGAGAGSGGGGQFAEYGGVDPNLDPELAMAIRISLEEAKNEGNQPTEGEQKAEGTATAQEGEAPKQGGDAEMTNQEQPAPKEQEMEADEDDYDAELEEAKRLSMAENEQEATAGQNEGDKQDDELAGVMDEDFLGEVMQDLGVPMSDDIKKE